MQHTTYIHPEKTNTYYNKQTLNFQNFKPTIQYFIYFIFHKLVDANISVW